MMMFTKLAFAVWAGFSSSSIHGFDIKHAAGTAKNSLMRRTEDGAYKDTKRVTTRGVEVKNGDREACGPETFQSSDGNDYRGCQDKTISGKTCQKWTAQSPHQHSRTPSNPRFAGLGLGDHNFCRNPDGEPAIWCYTTASDSRWEYCRPKPLLEAGFVRLNAAVESQCAPGRDITSWEQCKEAAAALGLTWTSGESYANGDYSWVPPGCSYWPAQARPDLAGTELIFNKAGSNNGNQDSLCALDDYRHLQDWTYIGDGPCADQNGVTIANSLFIHGNSQSLEITVPSCKQRCTQEKACKGISIDPDGGSCTLYGGAFSGADNSFNGPIADIAKISEHRSRYECLRLTSTMAHLEDTCFDCDCSSNVGGWWGSYSNCVAKPVVQCTTNCVKCSLTPTGASKYRAHSCPADDGQEDPTVEECLAEKECFDEHGSQDASWVKTCLLCQPTDTNVDENCRKYRDCIYSNRAALSDKSRTLLKNINLVMGVQVDTVLSQHDVMLTDMRECHDPADTDKFSKTVYDCNCLQQLHEQCDNEADQQNCLRGRACAHADICQTWKDAHCPANLAQRASMNVTAALVEASRPAVNRDRDASSLDETITDKRSC